MAKKSEIKILTDRIRSPLLSSPLKSAGPPARMKETKMPSPSSPPTMLKPRPVEPLCSNTFRGSLPKTATVSGWRRGQGLRERWAKMLPQLKETEYKHSWVRTEEPVNGKYETFYTLKGKKCKCRLGWSHLKTTAQPLQWAKKMEDYAYFLYTLSYQWLWQASKMCTSSGVRSTDLRKP